MDNESCSRDASRRVERESASRHVAEDKLSTADEQLKARMAEVTRSRREIRELQAEKARLRCRGWRMDKISGL